MKTRITKVKNVMTTKITLQMYLRAIELQNDGVSANDRKTQKHVRQTLRKTPSYMKTHDKNDRHKRTVATFVKHVLSLKTFDGVTPPTQANIDAAVVELK